MTGAAFFDVDGTLVKATIIHYYVFLRTSGMSWLARGLWLATFLPRIPWYLVVDKISRTRFNQIFYRGYAGLEPQQVEESAEELFVRFLQPRIYPAALERIRQHRREGHSLVLVTGSVEPLMAPLGRALGADRVYAARLVEKDGGYTGELEGGPVTGARKAEAVRHYMLEQGLSQQQCYAYADSLDDTAMLECVGHGVVVNPGSRLRRRARERGWEIVHWSLP